MVVPHDFPGKICCPDHGPTKFSNAIAYIGNDIKIKSAKCSICKRYFTNDTRILGFRGAKAYCRFGMIYWSGRSLQSGSVNYNMPTFFNQPINIIQSKRDLPRLTKVLKCYYLFEDNLIIQSLFSVDSQNIYCEYSELIKIIDKLPKHMPKIYDPYNYLPQFHIKKESPTQIRNDDFSQDSSDPPQKISQTNHSTYKENTRTFNATLYYSVPIISSQMCPFCKSPLARKIPFLYYLYKNRLPSSGSKTTALYCVHCRIPYVRRIQISKASENGYPRLIYPIQYSSKKEFLDALHKQIKLLPIEDTIFEDIAYDVYTALSYNKSTWSDKLPNLTEITASNELLIYAKKCSCSKCLEKYKAKTIVPRTAEVKSLSGKLCKVNVQFCMGCGQYFMESASLLSYYRTYGKLDFSYTLSDEIKPERPLWYEGFAEDSVLSRNGYSVKENIPKTVRQETLVYLMTYHIAEKYEILSLLNQFIELHEKTHPAACDRWMEDIEFVNNFDIDNQEYAGVLEMRQAGRITRKI